jgi:hypothetical protein
VARRRGCARKAGNVDCTGYSERRASIGSTRTALRAGNRRRDERDGGEHERHAAKVAASFGPTWKRSD